MDVIKCVGGCVPLFLVAVVLDVIGLIVLFVGIFANLRLDGRFYGDFLIYTGSLIIFISLFCWLMWYVGNVQSSEDNDGSKWENSVVERLARKLSERMSQKPTGVRSVKRVEDAEGNHVGPTAPRKASRVTWGKNSAYHNEGYDDSLDSHDSEQKAEKDSEDEEEI